MICALMLDLDDAPDFPGGTGQALGRPLAAYPFMAARVTGGIQRYYVVTGAQPVKAVALQNNAVIVDPAPSPNGSPGAAAEAQLRQGFKFAAEEIKADKETLELVVVFFSNAPCLTSDVLEKGLDAMQARPELDSAVTASPMPRWNPYFARRESEDGLLQAYVEEPPKSRGEVYYPDYGAQILRPRCLEGKCDGAPPFGWLGKKVLALKQHAAGAVDYKWQVPAAEYWLKKHGYSDLSPNLELQPQPKLQPKTDRR